MIFLSLVPSPPSPFLLGGEVNSHPAATQATNSTRIHCSAGESSRGAAWSGRRAQNNSPGMLALWRSCGHQASGQHDWPRLCPTAPPPPS